MNPELHLRLHQDRQAAALESLHHRHAIAQRPRPPSRLRESLARRLHRLADALEPKPVRRVA